MLDFRNGKDNWHAQVEYKNIIPDKIIAFAVPAADNLPVIYTAKIPGKGDSYYFYALVKTPQVNELKKKPESIGILWDVSGSAAKRDREKELKIIEAYVEKANDVRVQAIIFSVGVHATKQFSIKNGNSAELRTYLESFTPDGGTQLGCLHLADYNCSEFLMFSDGVQTFGNAEIQFSKNPVNCIATGSEADFSMLQYISRSTGGKFINAAVADISSVSESLSSNNFKFLSSQITGGNLIEVYPKIPVNTGSYFGVAGIMQGKEGSMQLSFGSNTGSTSNVNFNISNRYKADAGLLGRLWSQKKIAELDLQYEKNKDEITSLGKQFSVITRNTSLIVLDRLQDYVRYKITPPDENMKEEYYSMLSEQQLQEKRNATDTRQTHLAQVLSNFNDIANWYNKDFKPAKIERLEQKNVQGDPNGRNTDTFAVNYVVTDHFATEEITPTSAHGRNRRSTRNDDRRELNEVVVVGNSAGAMEQDVSVSEMRVSGVAASSYSYSVSNLDVVSEKKALSTAQGYDDLNLKGAIRLKAWDPKQPYIDELKKTAEGGLYKKYLSLRSQYEETPSFFIDAAEYLMAQNKHEEAVRVISNLAELKTESPELLRIMAHHLQQWNEMSTAIATYQSIVKLRSEEPQSYRDLGLVYEQNKEYQKAQDMFCKVVNKSWDRRFPQIEAFTACEINHMLLKSEAQVKTDSLDKRLIKNMPNDVRVVIDWDADNCDIDLWVTDPYGEKCFYSNKLTKAGGRISSDFTGGYGPEDFNLKKALPGLYKVQIHYYSNHSQTLSGPVTIHAQMYTNYGRANEVKKESTVRLTSNKEVVDIGEFEFVP